MSLLSGDVEFLFVPRTSTSLNVHYGVSGSSFGELIHELSILELVILFDIILIVGQAYIFWFNNLRTICLFSGEKIYPWINCKYSKQLLLRGYSLLD